MPLASLLATEFSAAIKDQGRACYLAGAVTIDEAHREWAAAEVRDKRHYEVFLDVERKTLTAQCSCSYTDEFFEPCKHIWATILLLDEIGGMPQAQQQSRLRLYLEGDREDEDDFEDDADDGERDEVPAAPRRPTVQPRKPRKPRTPSWKAQLAEVRQTTPVVLPETLWPAQRELLYVVDVTEGHTRGSLTVELMVREPKKNGELSKPKTHSVRTDELTALPDPQDRRVVAALNGAGQVAPYSGYGFGNFGASRFLLRAPLSDDLLPAMSVTGRLRRRSPDSGRELFPLTWDDGPAWVLTLEVVLADSGKQYVLTASLRRGDERRSLGSAEALLPGIVVWADRIGRLEDQGGLAWASLLQRRGPILIPKRDRDKLVAELFALQHVPRIELPADLRLEEVKLVPRPRVVIKPSPGQWPKDQLNAALSFLYDDQPVPSAPFNRGFLQTEPRRLLLRDRDAEQAAQVQMAQAGFTKRRNYGRSEDVFELKTRQLPGAVRRLVEAGWQVEAEGSIYRKPGEFKLQIQSGIDWFDIAAAVDFEGTTASLPTLLEALRRGETTVRLDDGTLGMMPEEWLKKYGFLAKMGTVEDDKVRFGRSQVGLLDALLADQPAVSLDQAFIKLRDELRHFDGVGEVDPPTEFVGTLRHYQREGLGWLRFLERFGFGGCLADDMGLGKTVQVLALLAGRRGGEGQDRPGPSLVVVPRSLIFNWKQEAARFAPTLKVLEHHGLGRSKSADAFDGHDLVLTTYGTLRRDVLLFKDRTFDFCILDESQAIKNAGSESAKAVRLLRAHHRLALSGTPVENHLGELWSLFEFLNPGMLGQASVFQLGAGQRNPDPDTRALLARALRPFILRRTKEKVAPELPAKTEQTLYCDMEPEQRKLYDELREHYRRSLLARLETTGLAQSKIQVLEALLRLRQAACHPGLIDKKRTAESSAKLDMLLPQLREVVGEGHKALVFSQFTSLLAIVLEALDAEGIAYEYLDGRTRDRQARVERFQTDPDCKLFLVSLKAGGVGLNLTAAEYVYLLDPWWNPAVEAQAIDRTHRIGQERPVFAYRLIARDTVEEKVLELQKTKRALADAIIGADNSLIRDLKREDLELLLS